jgi:hypothetical protein
MPRPDDLLDLQELPDVLNVVQAQGQPGAGRCGASLSGHLQRRDIDI